MPLLFLYAIPYALLIIIELLQSDGSWDNFFCGGGEEQIVYKSHSGSPDCEKHRILLGSQNEFDMIYNTYYLTLCTY